LNGKIEVGAFVCRCGKYFAIEEGLPVFLRLEELEAGDKEMYEQNITHSAGYDVWIDWLFSAFGEDKEHVREAMIDLLELQPGNTVLEIGAGTGEDSLHIAKRIAPDGQLYAQDISPHMLAIARAKLKDAECPVTLFCSNGSELPFADDTFDAVFHFGAINTYADKAKGINEMNRVAKPGAKVVFGDESVPPWLRETRFGRILRLHNPLYEYQPPLELLPPTAREVVMRWILGNAFYLIDYRVSRDPLTLEVDLKIPFKGDTMRSRTLIDPSLPLPDASMAD